LQAKEHSIRTTLIQIQSLLLPPLEVMKHALSLAEALLARDTTLTIEDRLIDLAATMEIQIQSLEVAKSNWESVSSMTQQLHVSFLNKYSISLIPQ
jgi:hypothetical protein